MRLIDADALNYTKTFVSCGNGKYEDANIVYETDIDAMPTIDTIKHAQWIKMSDSDGVYWACSECGENIPRVAHYNPQFDLFPRLESIDKTNYCPNCGAKMEKDEEQML